MDQTSGLDQGKRSSNQIVVGGKQTSRVSKAIYSVYHPKMYQTWDEMGGFKGRVYINIYLYICFTNLYCYILLLLMPSSVACAVASGHFEHKPLDPFRSMASGSQQVPAPGQPRWA